MVLTVAQCLDMALENDRLAAVAPKQSIKTQHTNLAEFTAIWLANTPSRKSMLSWITRRLPK